MTKADTKTTPFEAALRARGRKAYEFDVGFHFGLGDVPEGKVWIRTATKAEQDRALAGAHEYARTLAEKNPKVAEDPDVLVDTKSAFIAFEVCRDSGAPNSNPLFLSPRVMLETMTPDQISVLVNLANEVRVKEAGSREMSVDLVRDLAELCAKQIGTDIPEQVMAPFSREFLSHAFVLLAAENARLRAVGTEAELPQVDA